MSAIPDLGLRSAKILSGDNRHQDQIYQNKKAAKRPNRPDITETVLGICNFAI